ncbi:hypothetical protein BBJ28_00020898 [Nothophytophthora sp. Chile5]|nr:hypothetical protein BBJ28_00020898 [Nothophytophthora sp. Chile5]
MAERRRQPHHQRSGSTASPHAVAHDQEPALSSAFSFRRMDDVFPPRAASTGDADDQVSILAVDGSALASSTRSGATAVNVAANTVLNINARPPYSRTRRSWRRSPSDISTSYQPVDWASDDGVRFDGKPLRRTGSSPNGRNAGNGDVGVPPRVPSVTGSGSTSSSHSNSGGNHGIAATGATPGTTVSPTLHGKNILQLMAIGSVEPIARGSNSVEWSDSLGAVDESEDLSLMDPHYDLTDAKLTKLFSLFNPDGAWIKRGFHKISSNGRADWRCVV